MDRKERLLVVDDDSDMHSLLRTVLNTEEDNPVHHALRCLDGLLDQQQQTELRCLASFCDNGLDAIEAVKKGLEEGVPYSKLLIDIRMPGLDGVKVSREILNMDPDIQITFMSAYSDYTPEEISSIIGKEYSLLRKPLLFNDLHNIVVN